MENETIPGTPDSGSGTSIEKFKSPEDRDKAYLELEKLSYSQTQRLADMERRMDDMASTAANAPQVDHRQFTDMYPASNRQTDLQERETQLASRLLTKPSEVLREHAQYVRQETLKEVDNLMARQGAIARFQQKNPDLVRHEDLVATFVRKQPESLSPSERLDRAGSEVRKYLADFTKNINPVQSLDPNTYIESPTGTGGAQTSARVQPEPTDDDELSSFFRERSEVRDKKRL